MINHKVPQLDFWEIQTPCLKKHTKSALSDAPVADKT